MRQNTPTFALLGLAALLVAAPGFSQTRRGIPEAEAQAMLKAPVRADPRAAAVLRRSAQAYARLSTLITTSTMDKVKTVTRLKRPLYFHSVQSAPDGELIGLSVSDGKVYYEYEESSRKYVQRPATVLRDLALPVNARPFFADVSRGAVMQNARLQPTVRECAFAHAGEEKVNGQTADRLKITTLVRGRNGWRSFASFRSYDRKTGLVVRMVSGARKLEIKNQPNAKILTQGFVWKQIPGARRSFE